MAKGCCGQPAPRRLRSRHEGERLPRNPRLAIGVSLLYLGAGRRDFAGTESGHTYFVSEMRRRFMVHPDDVTGLLNKPFVTLEP
jgi:hypothetical protein